ncbi:hypothetical protein DM01DRAFT_1378379 [Hesseltinella vesiculosa]|uniref:Uncharacterized protein n=1 Tax=Hesseltinella vesiculosa TaxID=101127 RepID=A0A1X2G4B8_9FUNG|nr:hypothetical protein DM01DRAFT_1378379 [Hesseltinella vesiculosa]
MRLLWKEIGQEYCRSNRKNTKPNRRNRRNKRQKKQRQRPTQVKVEGVLTRSFWLPLLLPAHALPQGLAITQSLEDESLREIINPVHPQRKDDTRNRLSTTTLPTADTPLIMFGNGMEGKINSPITRETFLALWTMSFGRRKNALLLLNKLKLKKVLTMMTKSNLTLDIATTHRPSPWLSEVTVYASKQCHRCQTIYGRDIMAAENFYRQGQRQLLGQPVESAFSRRHQE